ARPLALGCAPRPGQGHPVQAFDRRLHRRRRRDAGQGRQPRADGRADARDRRLDARQPEVSWPPAAVPATPPPGGVVVSASPPPGDSMPPSPLRPALPGLLLAACLLAGCETSATGPTGAQPPALADGIVAIGAVQGDGEASPLLDRSVTVEGVVTGAVRRGLGGWFVQDAGAGDEATSDGVFMLADDPVELRADDMVRVRGRVIEHGDRERGTLTALQAEAVDVVGRGEVAPVAIGE